MSMPPPIFFIPLDFVIELVYTLIILIFCFLVYFKTREIYDLTKHKGIQFFRYAFLFFGLAYASRLFLYIMIVGGIFVFESFRQLRSILPISNLVTAYFSTIAILYLIYSTIWKKISVEHFLTLSNIVALFVAVIAFISISPMIVSLTQLLLLGATIFISVRTYEKDKKITNIRALYFLIAIFWLISLFVLDTPRMFLPFGLKVVLQIISLIVFSVIYYRVAKWIK